MVATAICLSSAVPCIVAIGSSTKQCNAITLGLKRDCVRRITRAASLTQHSEAERDPDVCGQCGYAETWIKLPSRALRSCDAVASV